MPVGDIPNQNVLECVVGSTLATDEREVLEDFEGCHHTRKLALIESCDGLRGECSPEHCGGMEDALFRGRQEIDACGDRGLDRLRHEQVVAALERAGELLREERIAADSRK